MLERLKNQWWVMKNRIARRMKNRMDLMSSYCYYCNHYYDGKCSGRYCLSMECRNFERLK